MAQAAPTLRRAQTNVQQTFAELRAELAENGYTDRSRDLIAKLERAHSRSAQLLRGELPAD